MKKIFFSFLLVLILTACSNTNNKQASRNTSQATASEYSCSSCTYDGAKLTPASLQSQYPPLTPAFTLEVLQAHFTTNPMSGVTMTYTSGGFTATSSSKILIGTLDTFGFLDTLSVDGTVYKFSYSIDGFVTSTSKLVNGSLQLIQSYVYDASGTIPIGFVNHETGNYVILSSSAPSPPPTESADPELEPNSTPTMMTVQSPDPCAGCYNDFNINMNGARNRARLCTTAALAGFVACEIFTAGVGTAVCFPAWVIANGLCIGNFLIEEQTNKELLLSCLQQAGCSTTIPNTYPRLHQADTMSSTND